MGCVSGVTTVGRLRRTHCVEDEDFGRIVEFDFLCYRCCWRIIKSGGIVTRVMMRRIID